METERRSFSIWVFYEIDGASLPLDEKWGTPHSSKMTGRIVFQPNHDIQVPFMPSHPYLSSNSEYQMEVKIY